MALFFEVYNPLADRKKRDHPISPSVSIRLATYRTEPNGAITLGGDLATEQEIDFKIDSLIKELEAVRKTAKNVLKTNIGK